MVPGALQTLKARLKVNDLLLSDEMKDDEFFLHFYSAFKFVASSDIIY